MSASPTRHIECARDLMTADPIRVGPGDSVTEVARLLSANEISGAPVVDGQDRVIGVVSRTDLIERCIRGPDTTGTRDYLEALSDGLSVEFDSADLGTVSDFMSTDPVVVSPTDTIGAVARRMREERVHRVIVVDDRRYVLGIITTLDLLRCVS